MLARLDAYSLLRDSQRHTSKPPSRLARFGPTWGQHHSFEPKTTNFLYWDAQRLQSQQVGALFLAMTTACLYMFVFDECPLPPKHNSQLQPKLRLRVRRLFLTESNTGLASKGQGHAEFGSCWKASHVKMLLWWFSKKATEFANMTRETLLVHLILKPLQIYGSMMHVSVLNP